LQRWNRWYFKTRLLKYLKPKFAIMKSTEASNQLMQQLKEAQAHLQEGPLRKRWRKPERKVPVSEMQRAEVTNRILSL
jgi:hypothetical protein